MVTAENETEKRLLAKMERSGFPGSVKTTVIWALRDEPDQTEKIEALLDSGATAREMVNSVQPIMKRTVARMQSGKV